MYLRKQYGLPENEAQDLSNVTGRYHSSRQFKRALERIEASLE